MALVLTERRCGQIIWVLQPGFEKQDAMACHRELINELQREALRLGRARVLEISTSETAYGPDRTHFNRAYLLQLGPVLFQLVDTSRQIAHMGCLACHQYIDRLPPEREIFPLRSWRRELAGTVWAPKRVGAQCQIAAPRRVTIWRARQVAHHRRAR
jgi:hypothetical protein